MKLNMTIYSIVTSQNISLHLIFLVLLFIVTFGQTDRNSFQFGKTVQNMLLDGHRKVDY